MPVLLCLQEERTEQIAVRHEERMGRSCALRQAHLAGIVARAGDEGRKVAEVAFINALQADDKKLSLQQKLEDGGWEGRREGRGGRREGREEGWGSMWGRGGGKAEVVV